MKRDNFLIIGALAQFALFIPIAVWANKRKQPLTEIVVTRLLQRKQSSFSRHAVQVLDVSLCSSAASNILAVPIAAILWQKQRRSDAIATLATIWTAEIVQKLIKRSIQRPRPNPLFVRVTKPRMGTSFPSGDVASSVDLWGWLLALGLFSRNESNPAKVVPLSIPALLIAFIGPARVYMGDHWATDVLGGYLFGGGWLCLSLYVYRMWQNLNQSYL